MDNEIKKFKVDAKDLERMYKNIKNKPIKEWQKDEKMLFWLSVFAIGGSSS